MMRAGAAIGKRIVGLGRYGGAPHRAYFMQSGEPIYQKCNRWPYSALTAEPASGNENERSFSLLGRTLSHAADQHQAERGLSDRHIRILDAAEQVFARSGFHAATMNDVALEAGMSPGNLYRYFPSKDAIVAGIAERDRSEIAADFAGLDPQKGGLLDQLEELGRFHLVHKPREKAIIALQIWAEAARNPQMAQMCAGIDGTVEQGLTEAVAVARENGELPANLDQARFLQAIFMMADGFFCRRAVDPEFDAAAGAETLFAAMRGLAAVMLLPPAADDQP
jgi:AcrR family transcriptional regulator